MSVRITTDQLNACKALVAEAVGSDFPFEVGAAGSTMDRIMVEFGSRLSNVVAEEYTNDERLWYFVDLNWYVVAPFLARVKTFNSSIVGQTSLWVDDVASLPGVAFTTTRRDQLAIPDRSFLRTHAYQEFKSELRASGETRWRDRSKVVFWRGASTGYRDGSWTSLPRVRLCAICHRHPLFDVALSNIVQFGDETEAQELLQTGYVQNRVAQIEIARYRTTIDIDGNSNAWDGLFTKMLAGNTILKVASKNRYKQWYYDRLIPWVHFVPVASDMSDLIEKAEWVRNNEALAEEIASAAGDLARSITMESAVREVAEKLPAFLR
jgi:hypothetical protein